jgi:RND family efflux transporter MFP subunit
MGFTKGGIIAKVYIGISSKVKKGDILISLINDDVKSSVDIAKAKYELSKKNYFRFKKIKNVIDEAQLNKYKYTYLQNKANLALAYANLNKTIIKAPYDGVVSALNYEQGDIVSAFREVLVIKQEGIVKLVLEFDEKYYNIVKNGDKFIYKIDKYRHNRNLKNTKNTNEYTNIGFIYKVYPSINTKTRKLKAEILAKNLPDGLFGDGYIITNITNQAQKIGQ